MMQRRLMLAALAAAVATPALAQMQDKGAAMPKGNSNDPAAKTDQSAMGAAEQKHVMDTMAAGSMSLAASRVAVKKARDEDVKQFAMFEVAEQETIADVLMSMMDPSKASGKIKPPSDAEVRQNVPQNEQAMLDKMQQMDGKEFDGAYIKAQTEGHQKLLRIQEDYLASGKNVTHLAVAKLARGQIKEHLQLLADLDDDDDKKGSATTGRSKK